MVVVEDSYSKMDSDRDNMSILQQLTSSTSRGQSPTMVKPKRPSGPGMMSIWGEWRG